MASWLVGCGTQTFSLLIRSASWGVCMDSVEFLLNPLRHLLVVIGKSWEEEEEEGG